MKNPVIYYFLTGVLCVQLVCSVPLASAATSGMAPQSDTALLAELLSTLQSLLAVLQQNVTMQQSSSVITSQENVMAMVTAPVASGSKGLVESVSADGVVSGWAIDFASPNAPALVAILVDGQVVGTTSTYVYRPTINTQYKVTGKHGITFALSTTTKADGLAHRVDVRVVATGALLSYAKTVSTTTMFTRAPIMTWSATSSAAGIPDIEIYHPKVGYEIFGNRQYATTTGGVVTRRVMAVHSIDGGKTWSDLGDIVIAPQGTDLGDGSMTSSTTANGSTTLLFAYRYNQATATAPTVSTTTFAYFSVRLKQSVDYGKTWTDFGTPSGIVHEKCNASMVKDGLWTPQVFFNNAHELMYNYDDQSLPDEQLHKNNGGQFGMLRTWNSQLGAWSKPIVIGQATAGRVDTIGARTQIALGGTRLWSPVESSVGGLPRSLALRFTESNDDGKTWTMTEPALTNQQIVGTDWTQGVMDESVLYAVPPRGLNASGTPGWYDWSWPLAVKLKQNPDKVSRSSASAIFVLFRSDEDLPTTVAGVATNNSHQVDKKAFYLFSTNGAKSWIKGRVTTEPIIDHRVVALHDGSVLVGYSRKYAPVKTLPYEVKKVCFTTLCDYKQ